MKKIKVPWGVVLISLAIIHFRVIRVYYNTNSVIWIISLVIWIFFSYLYLRNKLFKQKAKETMPTDESKKFSMENYFRDKNFWFGLLITSWIISSYWLAGSFLMVHMVILLWPTGISNLFNFNGDYATTAGIIVNVLFIIFLIYLKKIPKKVFIYFQSYLFLYLFSL